MGSQCCAVQQSVVVVHCRGDGGPFPANRFPQPIELQVDTLYVTDTACSVDWPAFARSFLSVPDEVAMPRSCSSRVSPILSLTLPLPVCPVGLHCHPNPRRNLCCRTEPAGCRADQSTV